MYSNNISALRRSVGLSQAQLASEAKVSLATLQNIEQGQANPSLKILLALLARLGASLQISDLSADLNLLAICGLPFEISADAPYRVTVDQFILELRKLALQTAPGQQSRVAESLAVLIFVIVHDYPSFAKANLTGPIFKSHLPKRLNPRMLKLRRITRNRIAKIL